MAERAREPDGHPRRDTLGVAETGYNGRLRHAPALLSAGVAGVVKTAEPGLVVAGLQTESPQRRVLRVAYSLTDADRSVGVGAIARLVLTEGVDTGWVERFYSVSLQGIAIAVPAGVTKVEVISTSFGTLAAETRVAASLSAGVLSQRWFADPNFLLLPVPIFPALDTIAAPLYATRCRVLVTDGVLVSPTLGTPIALPGQSVDLPIAVDGTVDLSAGVGTLVSVTWEITE